MHLKILVTAGDGIGPEVTNEAVAVLNEVAALGGHTFDFDAKRIGGVAIVQRRHAPARGYARRRARAPTRFSSAPLAATSSTRCPRQASRGRPACDSRRARRLRQPAPLLLIQGADGQQPPASGDRRRHRHHVRPRTARRRLLRQAPRVRQGKRASATTP